MVLTSRTRFSEGKVPMVQVPRVYFAMETGADACRLAVSAAHPSVRASRRQLASNVPFDCIDLAAQARFGTGAVVDLQVHADARALGLQHAEALSDDGHHRIPGAFEDRAHRRELVRHAAAVDDVQNARTWRLRLSPWPWGEMRIR
jgi:hypothetical protein